MTRPRGSAIAPLNSSGPVFPNVAAAVLLFFVLVSSSSSQQTPPAFGVSAAQASPGPAAGSTQQVITTVAGTDFVYPRQPLPGLRAPLGAITGLALDPAGNLYISDPSNAVVLKMDPQGVVTVIAGNGTVGFSGDGAAATSAAVNLGFVNLPAGNIIPESHFSGGIATDSAGNLFIADTGNHRVRKVSPLGVIATVAGNDQQGFSGDGAVATLASLNNPASVTVDSAGNMYIADTGNLRVRKVSPSGIITTVAGDGTDFYSQSGPATQSPLAPPTAIAVDKAGNLYIGPIFYSVYIGPMSYSEGLALAKVNGAGFMSLIPIPAGSCGLLVSLAFDASGNLFISDYCTVYQMTPDGVIVTRTDQGIPFIAMVAGTGLFPYSGFSGDGGPAAEALLNGPMGLAVDSAGNLFIADSANLRLRRVTAAGIISTVAGNAGYRYSGDGAPALSANLSSPQGVGADTAAGLYIADTANNRIRQVPPSGIMSTLAGTGDYGFSGDDGPAIAATLRQPHKVAVGLAGDVLIADSVNSRARRVNRAGTISTVTGGGWAVAADANGDVFSSDPNGVFKIAPDGALTTPVHGVFGYDIASDAVGNLLVADGGVNVHGVTTDGVDRVIAGNNMLGFSGDGGPAAAAALNKPTGVAMDAAGNVYIADSVNHRVRKVTTDGVINTLAGTGTASFSGDGGAATAAALNNPMGVAVDAGGNVYIADTNNNRVRVVLANPPAVHVSVASLSFSGQSTGAPAPAQTFSITSVPGMGFSLTVATLTGGNWLSVTPPSGAAPRLIDVVADPSKLTSAGTYQGTVTVATLNANPTSTTVNVTFRVTAAAPASLALDRQSFSFSFARATPAQSQRLTVSNTGGGTVSFSAAATVAAPRGGTWLTVSPASGQATAASPVTVTVTANPVSLAAGTYTGAVTVSAGGTQSSVPVTMTISALDQAILLSQQGLGFTAVAQGGVIPPQTFAVRNIGTGAVHWTASTSTLPTGLGWLQVTPASGTTDAAQSPPTVTVSVKLDGLAAGVYYGIVQVDAPSAANSPQVLTVFLQVLPAGADTAAVVGPGSLLFSTTPGGGSPGSQNLAVYSITANAKTFRSSVVADAGLKLVTLPADATLDPQQPMQVVVQPFTSGLGAGVFSGTVTLQFDDGRVSRVNVKVIVASGAGTLTTNSPESLRRGHGSAATDACTPTKLVPILTTMPDSFELSVGWPAALAAQVHDDCGTPLQSGSVSVTFSNGDTPVQLQLQQGGRWEGTWPARGGAQSHVTLHLHAEGAQSQIAGDQQVAGSLLEQQQPPVFDAAGIVGVFGGPAYTALAPGAVISIYGDRLAEIIAAAPAFPLQTTLAGTGTQVTMQGRKMPLYYGSQGQVNAVVPYGVNINAPQQIIVQRENTLSLPIQVNMAPAQPALLGSAGAITAFPAGGGAPYAVSSDTPAHAGDTVVFYCVGLGAVSPPVSDGGLPSQLSTADNAKDAQLLIGSQLATVSFMGLTSQFPGLYQVNGVVPQGTPKNGAVSVVLNIGGQSSQQITMAIQ
jgi:uncharacterized protein (TIGR03437 family)